MNMESGHKAFRVHNHVPAVLRFHAVFTEIIHVLMENNTNTSFSKMSDLSL